MAHELGESDWGDWLPTAVADADPDGVAIWYLGCNGFVLKGSDDTTLFIDPYCGLGDPPRTVRMLPVPFDPADVAGADAVLATHEHSDHVHGPTQAPILAATGADHCAPDASMAVVEAIARVDDTTPTALEPLVDTIDPAAIDRLTKRTKSNDCALEFRYIDHVVTVRSRGIIEIRPADD